MRDRTFDEAVAELGENRGQCASRLDGPCAIPPTVTVFKEHGTYVQYPGARFCQPHADELMRSSSA